MKLHKTIDNLFYGMDKVKQRRLQKQYESEWIIYNGLSEIALNKALFYFKDFIRFYFLSIKNLFKSLRIKKG